LFKSTHVQGDLVQVEEGAARLFGPGGLTVVQVVIGDTGGRIVHAVTADEVPAGCPECGVVNPVMVALRCGGVSPVMLLVTRLA
jgi:hypothetical protein